MLCAASVSYITIEDQRLFINANILSNLLHLCVRQDFYELIENL